MANGLKGSQATIVAGLGTSTFAVTVAGPHFIKATCTDVPPSGVVITINVNGSPIGTSASLDSSRQSIALHSSAYCSVADIITVVLTSSNSNDSAMLNNVKTVIQINSTQNA